IIKGWVDATGKTFEQLYEVAGHPHNGAAVDLDSCQPSGPGDDSLCAVWTDPSFDPAQHAFYYARVVENPTCSVNQRDCNTFAAGQKPAACTDANVQKVVQHRAWTSPIWYQP